MTREMETWLSVCAVVHAPSLRVPFGCKQDIGGGGDIGEISRRSVGVRAENVDSGSARRRIAGRLLLVATE